MVHDLYERLKAGESITVRALSCGPSPGGRVFTIHPVYWESIVLGFQLEVHGKIVREHRGELFDRAKMDSWAQLLEEIVGQPTPPEHAAT
jgi:hypothetical protein